LAQAMPAALPMLIRIAREVIRDRCLVAET
jgi:hypothetical protein